MKKRSLVAFIAFMFFAATGIFAEEGPIKKHGWYYQGGVTLKGELFFDVANSYKEQDGWALVDGRKLHYWLYDSYTYHDGNDSNIFNKYIPSWVEGMGYVIDFDNIKKYNPSQKVSSSEKALMKQRNCDVSVALVTDDWRAGNHYVVINSYSRAKQIYITTIMPLIQ